MTCASCANRIERKLNKLTGVRASVNFATERATVDHPADITIDHLLDTVRAAGYQASAPSPRTRTRKKRPARRCDCGSSSPPRSLSRCWCCRWCRPRSSRTGPGRSSHSPPRSSAGARCLSTAPPPATCCIAPRPWTPWSRSGSPSPTSGRSTLCSSAGAGDPDLRVGFSLLPMSGTGAMTYFDVAAGVTAFLLLGRWLEARSRRKAGAALRALLEVGRQGSRGAPRRRRDPHPDRPARPSAPSSWSAPVRRSPPTV